MTTLAASHDHFYVLQNLVEKDFKVRYRNMSLGIFWSLVNPLVMMVVLTYVFTTIVDNPKPHFPLFVLMGLLPYNFFSLAWSTATNSVVENASLIKKVPFSRELIPISTVLGNTIHYLIQLALLLVAVGFAIGVSIQWLWLPLIVVLQVIFVCGISLITSSLNVYYRDVRYVVESATLILFWLVPIFYGLRDVPSQYAWLYELNPIAAVILVTRRILLNGAMPGWTLLKLALVSSAILIMGFLVFSRIKRNFSDSL